VKHTEALTERENQVFFAHHKFPQIAEVNKPTVAVFMCGP
jgi:hypothetical protein